MKVAITGKHMNVGESLSSHIETTVSDLTEKYFSSPLEASVIMTKGTHHDITTDISVHVGRGLIARGNFVTDDPHRSFDGALSKLEAQLRKYKNRIRDHHMNEASKDKEQEMMLASTYVLESADESDKEEMLQPAIIAEMEANIPTLSVSEAVMRLDLSGDDAFIFHNSSHGDLNVVHWRKDGNVGWIDPSGNRNSKTFQ